MHDIYDKRAARQKLVARILEGEGKAPAAQRRAAFDNRGLVDSLGALINKVVVQPARVTDKDIASAKMAGLSEDQIFELLVCAAVGESSRRYESALMALDRATDEDGDAHAS